MSQDMIGGEGQIGVEVRVVAYKNKPGIGRIFVGDMEVFNGDDAVVGDIALTVRVPFHTHFETPNMAVVWREPNGE